MELVDGVRLVFVPVDTLAHLAHIRVNPGAATYAHETVAPVYPCTPNINPYQHVLLSTRRMVLTCGREV